MSVECKELFVGGKVIVIRTEGEFDAFEALVVKIAVTRKSAIVIRSEHADEALKAHGASWMHMVLQAEDNKDLIRASLEEMYKPTADVNKFITEFKSLAEARQEITKKMEQLANQYSFHVAGEEHKAKLASSAKKGNGKGKKGSGKKSTKSTVAEPAQEPAAS